MQFTRMQWVLCCLIGLALAGPAFAVTGDSNTWEGRYECDALPTDAGWTAKASGADAYAKVEDDKLIIDTLGSNQFPYWLKETKLDVTRGISLEWRVRIKQTEAGDIASGTVLGIRSSSGSALNDFVAMSIGEAAIHCQGADFAFDAAGRFHIYRLTLEPSGYKLYVDGNVTPIASGPLAAADGSNGDQGIQFGDHSAEPDAAYEIDYIRWTTSGAMAPYGKSSADDESGDEVKMNEAGFRALAGQGNLIIALPAAAKSPKVDGVINPDEYAFSGLGFIDVVSGQYASQQSKYHLSYDATALYVAIESPIVGQLRGATTRRDDSKVCLDDSAEMFIIPGADVSPLYQLIVNAAGTLFDQKDSNADWNITHSVIRNQADGDRWIMEAAIAFSDLGVKAPKSNDVWRLNLCRTFAGNAPLYTGMSPTRHSYLSPRRFAYVRFVRQSPRVVMKSIGELLDRKMDLNFAMDSSKSAGAIDVQADLSQKNEVETLVQKQFEPGAPIEIALRKDDLTDQGELRIVSASEKLGVIYAGTFGFAASKDKFHQTYIYTDRTSKQIRIGVHVPMRNLTGGSVAGTVKLLQGQTIAAEQSFTAAEVESEIAVDMANLPAGDYQTEVHFGLPNSTEPVVLRDTYRRYADGPSPWDGNQAGITDQVPEPWTAVVVEDDAVNIWDRTYDFAGDLLPAHITSRDRQVLAAPMSISASVDGQAQTAANVKAQWTAQAPANAQRQASGNFGAMKVRTDAQVDFDGYTWIKCTLESDRPLTIDSLRIDIPLNKKYVTLRNLGDYRMERTGALPSETFTKDLREKPVFWLGDETGGLQWFAESLPGWNCADWSRSLEVINQSDADRVIARLNVIDSPIKLEGKREIEFGFMATPVKPVRPDWRSWRIAPSGSPAAYNWFIWFTEWTKWVNYPDPSVLVQEKVDLLNAFHRNGVRVTPYMTLGITTPFSPEFKFYGDDWLSHPTRLVRDMNDPLMPQWDIWACYLVCNNSRSYRDFFAQKMEDMLSQMKTDGIYFDYGTSRLCGNELHGCGYVDNTGQKQRSYNFRGTREMARRAYVIIHKYATANPLIVHHMSGEVDMPSNSFCDIMLTGENLTGALMTNENYYKALPLDKFRAEFIGAPFGPLVMDIPQFERAMAVTSPDRVKFYSTPEGQKPVDHLIGMTVVHDSLVWPSDGVKPDRFWKVRDDFGWDEKVEFFPYWDNAAYITIAEPVSNDVVVSIFRRDDRLMIVPFNNTDQPVTIQAKINLESLGFSNAGPEMTDEYFGQAFMQQNGQVEIPVDARSFRMIVLKRS